MSGTFMVGVFDTLEAAQEVRVALLAEGMADAGLQLEVRTDEAGPVEGNFAVGNSPLSGEHSDSHTYQDNYAMPVQRGQFMVIIERVATDDVERVATIFRRHGGRQADPLAAGGTGSGPSS